MNGLLNKFRKRNIQANLPHFILVIFVVAVSACLITGLFISHLTLKTSVQNFYTRSNLPNLWIKTNTITADDEVFLSRFEYGKRYVFDQAILIDGKTHNSQMLVSNGDVSKPYILEGTKGKGCYVDAKFIQKHRIGVYNSKVNFDFTINNETHRLSFVVLGSLALAEDLLVDDECVIFIDEEVFISELRKNFADENIKIDYNQILITSKLTGTDKVDINNYYENRLDGGATEIKTQEDIKSFEAVKNEINVSGTMLVLLPSLFVIVSILVVISAITELTLKERYNIGLLKSIGIKNGEILSNYCGYGVYMCLIGAVIGMLVAPLIVPNITFEAYDIMFNLPRDEVRMIVPYWLILAIIFVVILIGYFSAFIVCFKFALQTPKECMQGVKKIKKEKRHKKKRGGLLFSAIRNMRSNPVRTLMSLFSITGSSLLILLGYGVGNLDKLDDISQNVRSFQMFSSLFSGFAIVILFLAIIIIVMQILREKSREIAMQRIHGESYVMVWLRLMLELILLGIFAYLLAGVLMYPITVLMMSFFGIKSAILINFIGVLKTFLWVFGFMLIASLIAIIKIYKTNLVDATKFSE